MTIKVDAILGDFDPCFGFYFLQDLDRDLHMYIQNLLSIQTVNVTMGFTDVAIKPPVCPIDALNNPLIRQRL